MYDHRDTEMPEALHARFGTKVVIVSLSFSVLPAPEAKPRTHPYTTHVAKGYITSNYIYPKELQMVI